MAEDHEAAVVELAAALSPATIELLALMKSDLNEIQRAHAYRMLNGAMRQLILKVTVVALKEHP